MYSLFYGLVASVIDICSNSVSAVLGQLFHRDRRASAGCRAVYETVFLAICFALFTLTDLFILPVLRLYTAGATDISYIDPYLPALFTCMQVLNYGRIPSNNIVSFAGHFRQTQGRAIVEMAINLVVSLICVGLFGIYGVLFGTIAALLYRTNDFIVYANRVILGRSPWPTYRRWLRNAGLMALCIGLGSRLPSGRRTTWPCWAGCCPARWPWAGSSCWAMRCRNTAPFDNSGGSGEKSKNMLCKSV